MNRPFVWTLVVLSIAATMIGATWAFPDWPLQAGCDFWNAPQYECELDRCRRIGEELEEQRLAVRERSEFKKQVARQVKENRLTLEEAAVRFRDGVVFGPDFFEVLRRTHPGASDDELICRNVICAVDGLSPSPRESTRAVAPLNLQLLELKKKGHGRVRLP